MVSNRGFAEFSDRNGVQWFQCSQFSLSLCVDAVRTVAVAAVVDIVVVAAAADIVVVGTALVPLTTAVSLGLLDFAFVV